MPCLESEYTQRVTQTYLSGWSYYSANMKTALDYVSRTPILEKEKSFDTDFLVDWIPGARRSNIVFEQKDVLVTPILDSEHWDIDQHGFCILKAKTNLSVEKAFEKEKETQKAYWYEIEALLHDKFPQHSRIEGYDFTVCSFFECPKYPNRKSITNLLHP